MRKGLLFSAVMLAAGSCATAQIAFAQNMSAQNMSVPGTSAQTASVQTTLAESGTPAAIQQSALPNLPAEMKLTSLDSSWRRFTTRSSNDPLSAIYGRWALQYDMVMAELGVGVHFTKGDSIRMGKENYLIAYRIDPGLKPDELQEELQQRLQAAMGHGRWEAGPQPAGKFGPSAKLKLSLLNLQNIGDMEELRAFNPAMDILNPKELRDLSNFNLRRLGQILDAYSEGELELSDVEEIQQILRNIHQPVSILRNPADEKPYRFNSKLSGKEVDSIKNSKAVVVAYEATPASDNTRGVLFLDWHVERIPEWRWPTVRAVQPQSPTAADYRAKSAHRMRLIFRQMLSWASDAGEMLPTNNAHATRRALMEENDYNPPLYQEPQTGQQYRFNPAISKLKPSRITNRSRIVALYEPTLGSDGKRGAIFLDGVVRRVSDAQWKSIIRTRPRLKRR